MQNFVLVGKAKNVLRLIEIKANRDKGDKSGRRENNKERISR